MRVITPTDRVHILKADPVPFDAVAAGVKTCEVRVDDRGYEVGDILILRRTKLGHDQRPDGSSAEYTGHLVVLNITHIQRGYGLPDNLAVLSFQFMEKEACLTTLEILGLN